ncbi:class I SAM-dependent methyltransferase [Candidatus Bathyarchaeota archaeon]|nr:class I SAM-dependent methyltransferase [Candidatus Bathyarchaeota archaeon]MBS7630722.1 class I SAM-dependent methyltransferase [Candidatus Bathyarchaeota archaeon]
MRKIVWTEVEVALEEIINEYERVNHFISFFQDERSRTLGLRMLNPLNIVGLELGTGPGNFTSIILKNLKGSLIGLDYSEKMLDRIRKSIEAENLSLIRGVFEYLPIKKETLSFIIASYALRDSKDKRKTLKEIKEVLRDDGGELLIVDIGRPDNPVIEKFLRIYMRWIVPIIGGIIGRKRYRNPWGILSKTYLELPSNRQLLRMVKNHFSSASMREIALGGLLIITAVRES